MKEERRETEYNTLREGEPHPMAALALKEISKMPAEELIKHREALSSCAIEGNRIGQICSETLDQIMHSDAVSDRYLLGLYCYLKRSQDE